MVTNLSAVRCLITVSGDGMSSARSLAGGNGALLLEASRVDGASNVSTCSAKISATSSSESASGIVLLKRLDLPDIRCTAFHHSL